MPANPPLTASGSRELKRPRPIPRSVRAAIVLMVYGEVDDPDCAPLDFIEAAKRAGVKPDVMRRYLDRAEVRALLRSERRAFREAICAGNEGALQRVRDKSANSMAQVAAVRALEQLDAEATARPLNASSPGIVICIVPRGKYEQSNAPQPVTIDAKPAPAIEHEPRRDAHGRRLDANGDPIFDFDPYTAPTKR
ncbi:hypothetical protein SAMN05414138_10216 [Rhodoplanes sp. JGI PP 4-B12]|uniref:hypothetical protein n=1 Tax=Rhodoplanes sp. JGI PP 4-B12 TaxID=1873883 RepID=UPI000B4FDACB|nr:hypothetical protein [Rhodoplanes sp. JGI PP 4-B12]SNB54213.1 hypothetical protein SAMN05414138_10216 [Rhodoplanes sp. JGI PP 4-B12]